MGVVDGGGRYFFGWCVKVGPLLFWSGLVGRHLCSSTIVSTQQLLFVRAGVFVVHDCPGW